MVQKSHARSSQGAVEEERVEIDERVSSCEGSSDPSREAGGVRQERKGVEGGRCTRHGTAKTRQGPSDGPGATEPAAKRRRQVP
ncbi:hypothetical protein BDK51DRAFT_41073 [Blyttiomyces helicus]|uniref:Uncharacterized protein n=1 Tax=Blyttiomyces helicus TaxID=388810 RepID=A0A4P9WHV7_9FUNG|nr:hypothetical protein BDK51DRAFT_41073 [Blyttiomyces helicus]|eukprot:RKO91018.1 hypothetical protein BDK51DRAFT_41073 [Blyttiomyces helicus]